MIIKPRSRSRRDGSMLPLLAVSAISLFAFVALAVDLGMLAVSRTQCQNAADASALAGCRTLNNKPGVTNSNLGPAVTASKTTVSGDPAITNSGNVHLSARFTASQIQKIETGQYLYNTSSQQFSVSTWTDVTNSQTATPASGSWTAIRTTLSVTQPTYFMKVLGVTSMPTGAAATAVYRPRDVAFVLDMTGSMAYASNFNYNNVSLNPDTIVPTAGHYVNVQSNLVATANQSNSNGEAISRNNFTITTPGGPPIVRNFYFDPANVTTPATSAFPVTSTIANLKNAFHRWKPPETGGDATNYIGVTYDFTGYNAFHNGTETNPKGPTPAPDTFGSMTDTATVTYVGDRWRRADGSINKTDTTWATGATSTRAAATAAELLGYNVTGNASGSNVRKGVSGTTNITTVDKFRDPVWETYGYDLNIPGYRTWKTNSNSDNPGTSAQYSTLVATGDRFIGYSMGPGYWGKTFYCWPPDPRFDTTANLTSPDTNKPGFDTSGKAMCDWRRHFFLNAAGGAFTASSGSTTAGLDASLLRTSGSGWPLANSGFTVNYPAVLKWIKTGPQVMPPNLRAGRVLYYSSIPDTVTGGTGEIAKDQLFWKTYIDYVLGVGMSNFTSTNSNACLYGYGDSPTGFTMGVYTATSLNTWTGPSATWTGTSIGSGAITPYMSYADAPLRPRLHFWFGPLSMMDFIANYGANRTGGYVNWNPGTCNEAQCWQLKSGMNSVLSDVQSNHPNDYVGLTMFAYNSGAPPTIYQHPRVPTGQNYTALKNALFYPKSLLTAINGGDKTTEERPYDTSFNSVAPDEIPNANGGTDPNTGLAIGFNLLSPSASLPAEYLTTVSGATVQGRRGSSKVIIFETDGVPNSYSTYTLNKKGYDTYYSAFANGGSVANGNSAAITPALNVVKQFVLPMASTNGTGTNSGLGLPNAPARVFPIGFGDLFDPVASPGATFRQTAENFLSDIASNGNTTSVGSGATRTIPSYQIITGPYDTRIANLKDCMQRIFQSGVAVTLIE
jgi:hypothetical protein